MPSLTGHVLAATVFLGAGTSETHFTPPPRSGTSHAAPGHPGQPDLGAPLEPAPELVTGRLDNGVRYFVLRNASPPGKAEVWLHVAAGCLNDPPGKRGIAHFVEHMAFEGSENFPPGSFGPFLESLGLAPSEHGFSTTGYDMTRYGLTIPDTQPETFDTALLFLADVAGRLKFPAERVEAVREVLNRERRTGLSPDTRLADIILPRIAPGSLLATRSIVGDQRSIGSITPDDLGAFYGAWYVPTNVSVIVVGDADPAMVVGRIGPAFGGLPARAGAERPVAGVVPTSGVTAAVAQEREARGASVTLARIEPARPPAATVGDWRRQFIERIAVRAFDLRLDESIALNRARFRSADARAGQIGRVALRAEVEATGPVSDWGAMLTDLIAETARIRRDGFEHAEISRARDGMLGVARRSAETAAVRPAAQLVRLIDGALDAGEPFLSAAQELELGTALLRSVTDEEVNGAFARLFDPDNSTVVLVLPTGVDPVPERELLAAATGRAGAPGAGDAPKARSILSTLPPDGEVADSTRHVGASVLTLRFENHVVVHYRLMEHRHETVTITALMPGGELRETGPTRGLTRAAAEAFRTPATSALSADEVSSILLDRAIVCTADTPSDALGFSITGPPEQIETGFQLAHALITDPTLADEAIQSWKVRQSRALEAAHAQPDGAFALLILDTIYPPGELRPRPLTAEEVGAVSPGAARRWLAEALGGPLEISIVGKIDEARAVKLATRYFGSLPARPPIEPDSFAALRKLPRPAGDRTAVREVKAREPLARLAVGFFGPDESAVQDVRLMRVAVRALDARLRSSLHDQQKLASSITIGVSPGVAYPGYGLVYAAATTEPANASALADAIGAALAEFARAGPTPDELKAAKRAVDRDISVEILEPQFWTDELRDLNYRATNLDDVLATSEAVRVCTADEVRAAFARYHDAGPALRVVVLPEPQPASTTPAK